MEQNGGCCIARSYTNNPHNMSKVDRMMLTRFRPIAPKPPSPTTNFHVTTDKLNTPVKPTGRGKRKNPTSTKVGRKRKSPSPEKKSNLLSKQGRPTSEVPTDNHPEPKTLSFLPEAPGVKDITPCKKNFPRWLNFGCNNDNGHVTPIMDHVTYEKLLFKPVGPCFFVKVECVMDTWMVDGYGWYGRTDEERVMGLSVDTCPGFVTDGLNRVTWTNVTFKRMVGGEGEVAVVVEEGVVVPVGVSGFTCRVRVFGQCNKTVPCDVWRMECGGFAWRLDTMVALSLGW